MPCNHFLSQAKHCFIPFVSGEPPPSRSTLWEGYRLPLCVVAQITHMFLPPPSFLPYSYIVDRNTISGHILIINRCFFVCTHHIYMTAHTPALTGGGLLELSYTDTTKVAVEHNRCRSQIGCHQKDSHQFQVVIGLMVA